MRRHIDLSVDRSKVIKSLGGYFSINLSYYQELFSMYNNREKTRTTAYLNLLKELFIAYSDNIINKYYNHSLIELYEFEYLKNNLEVSVFPSSRTYTVPNTVYGSTDQTYYNDFEYKISFNFTNTSFNNKLNYVNLEKLGNEIKKQNGFFNFIINSYNEGLYDNLLIKSTLRFPTRDVILCNIDIGLIKLLIDNEYEITMEELIIIHGQLFSIVFRDEIDTLEYIKENIHKIKTKDFDLRDFKYETTIYELQGGSKMFSYLKSNEYIKSMEGTTRFERYYYTNVIISVIYSS
jgi:hypothetical protein